MVAGQPLITASSFNNSWLGPFRHSYSAICFERTIYIQNMGYILQWKIRLFPDDIRHNIAPFKNLLLDII